MSRGFRMAIHGLMVRGGLDGGGNKELLRTFLREMSEVSKRWVSGIYVTCQKDPVRKKTSYEGWNFNSGNYLFTTDTK